MSDITGAKKNIQIEGARFGSAVSESLIQAVGGSINYLNGFIDSTLSGLQTNMTNIAANTVMKYKTSALLTSSGSSVSVTLGANDFLLFVGTSTSGAISASGISGAAVVSNGSTGAVILAQGAGTLTISTAGLLSGLYIVMTAQAIST